MRMVTHAKLFSGDVAHSLVITVLNHRKNGLNTRVGVGAAHQPPHSWNL